MKKASLLFTILGLILLSFSAIAQVKVKGKVIDKETGESLIGATVVVEKTTVGVATNIDGSFVLEVPSGNDMLIVTFIGYVDQKVKISSSSNSITDLGVIKLESNTIGIEEVYVVSSFARDRQTPVSMSTIKPEQIAEKLGGQEFPEILKSTPSVYSTKTGGGYGDSRINLRGFDSNNIGVLINGVPVNDMENGKVYWSNWAGLSDVTQTMQVQRGLGASKVALSSTGGTINVLTKSTDAEQGGSIFSGYGNSGYRKQSFSLSTGLLKNGWAISILGAHNYGNGYIKGTEFDAWTYFLNVSKKINEKHRLSFTAFGAPQWHNQRGNKQFIQTYRDHKDKFRMNTERGLRNGEWYNGAYGYNKYHKPQLSLNHYWTINESTKLSTAAYASISKGGGRKVLGPQKNLLGFDYTKGKFQPQAKLTSEGYLDFDAVTALNADPVNGAQVVQSFAVNQHNWFGILSSLTKKYGNLNFTLGFDGRYYVASHFEKIDDMLGGQFLVDKEDKNVNRTPSTLLKTGDKVNYYNLGEVSWAGLFAQAEYVTLEYSAFLSASMSNQRYRRTDYFLYKPGEQKSDWQGFMPWSVKGGFNYNINDNNNVFVNGGYFTRAPYFNVAFFNNTNKINPDIVYEKIINAEAGYGFTSRKLKVNATAYYTNWKNRSSTKVFGADLIASIHGIDAKHIGVELEASWIPIEKMMIKIMGSYGDWLWQNNFDFSLYDGNLNFIDKRKAYLKGVHVGNSAQATAAISFDYEVLPKVKLGVDWNYYGKNYADFDPTNRTVAPLAGQNNPDAWQMPDFTTVDLNLNWRFKLSGLNATLYGNVNNLFNTEYVADATDGTLHNMPTALVYYGFGTTWTTGLKINF